MREQGYRPHEIGLALGRHPALVCYALYPETRAKAQTRQQRYEAKRMSLPGAREKRAAWDAARDQERKKLRAAARHLWREGGGKPGSLEKIYREYGCL
jgi:hypothetical protein